MSMKFVCNAVFISSWYLNCLCTFVIAPILNSVNVARHRQSLHFFAILLVAGCMQWTPTALTALQECPLKFPLPALLLVYDHDYSHFLVIQIHTS
jgi:hypothetical protein